MNYFINTVIVFTLTFKCILAKMLKILLIVFYADKAIFV